MKHRLLAIATALTAGQACSTLIAHDSYETFSNGALNTQNGYSVVPGAFDYRVVDGGLAYSNGTVTHDGTGKHVQIRNVGGSATQNPASRPIPSTTSEPVYFSFLVRLEGPDTWGNFFLLGLSDDSDDFNSGAVALRSNGPVVSQFFTSRVYDGTTNTGSPDFGSYGQGEVHLVVGRLQFDGGSSYQRLDVLLDPASTAEPIIWDSTVSGPTNLSAIDTVFFRIGSSTTPNGFNVDELRVGTTFSSVVIPEPTASSLLLAALVLGTLARQRLGTRP